MTVSRFTSRDLTFDPGPHVYRLPDLRLVPNVTTILRETRCSKDFDELRQMSAQKREEIDLKRDLGTALHADSHAYDDGDIDLDTVDPRVRPFLDAWIVCRANLGLQPVLRERFVFHPDLFYCGTLDGLFWTPKERLVLIDLATGDPWDAGKHLQTAGYEGAYRYENPGVEIHERWAVQLVPGQRIPYRVVNFSDYRTRPDGWKDWQKFQACVCVYNEQPARRRAA